uniref:CCHC-type domain-containing protein n=1 Tax=Oryza rufipogon TaxID=4529 RepID=A0A0E0NGN8_ORYRU
MARRSTRQTRAPNRFGVEEELVQSEIPDQPANQTDEQEAESDHMAKASQHSNGSGSTSCWTMSEPGQQATMINSNSHEGSNSVPCPTPSKRRGYKAGVECFICHEMGHYSWDCPQKAKIKCLHKVKTKPVQPTTILPNIPGSKGSKSPNSGSVLLTSPPVGQGRLNHVQVETNEKVVNLEQVEGAGEEQVPQARAKPQ